MELISRGEKLYPPRLCQYPTDMQAPVAYGCGTELAGNPEDNYWIVPEDYYLKNVIALEMNIMGLPSTPAALRAQAVASRTFAYYNSYWLSYGNSVIDNSTAFQVFIPGSFTDQSDVNSAVDDTSGQYLAGSDGNLILAEFASDSKDFTVTSSDTTKPYLTGVQDPISSTCDSADNGHQGDPLKVRGMSQMGALRWSKGNECANAQVDAPQTWSVKWDDYRQILAHYYTGVNIAGTNPPTPDDRWNLLKHDNFGSPIGSTPTLISGSNNPIYLMGQNTSTRNWTGDVVFSWQWVEVGAQVDPTKWEGNIPLNVPKGESFGNTQSIVAPITATDKNYILHFDVKYPNGDWFAKGGWPDAQIAVTVNGVPTPTPTPLSALPLTYTGMSYGCTSYYVVCNAAVNATQTDPYRLDFDVTYYYNKWWNGLGTDFNVELGFDTNVFGTDVPLYWEITPVTNEIMPSRSIITQFSGTPDLAQMDLDGYWLMPGQPWPYKHFRVNFLRSTSAWEIFTRTEQWHLTIATYDFKNATPTPTPTLTPTPTPSCNLLAWICNLQNSVQDFFNRIDGFIGENWGGDTGGYSVSSNALNVETGSHPILWQTSYGADQFAFITMSNVDENGGEQGIILKSQSPASASSGGIEVVYDAADHVARVMTNAENQGRVQRGEDIAATFIDGDQFTARARPDGMVEIYRNDQLLGTRDVTAWPYYAEGGYTDLLFVDAGDAVLDDFGGGTVSIDSTPTPTNTSTPTPTPTNTSTPTPTPTFTPTVAPLVVSSVTRNNANPTNLASVSFTVTFSETVTGVDINDFNLTTSGITGATISGVSGSGSAYTVSVNTGSGDGTIRLDVKASGTDIQDLTGNPISGGFAGGQTYTINKTLIYQSLASNDG